MILEFFILFSQFSYNLKLFQNRSNKREKAVKDNLFNSSTEPWTFLRADVFILKILRSQKCKFFILFKVGTEVLITFP